MLTGSQIRQKYLDFFRSKGHVIIPSAPLVPENDPSTLFTSSGMQPLIPNLLGQAHPSGKRLTNSQKCFRAQDIDEVGDNRHTTFFEMLGNWSLGDYFKSEQLAYIYEFITKELSLPIDKLFVSVFAGGSSIPKDEESISIWKKLGISSSHIFPYPAKKNWWSRSGEPEYMPPGEPGGPDSEIFYDFGPQFNLHENSVWKNEICHPNCDCGRYLEIGNSVFMQYQKQPDGTLKELPQKNVDFGGGLERMTMAVSGKADIFQIDLFSPIINMIETVTQRKYFDSPLPMRIIADHLKAATFLMADGASPSNKSQGYMVRRLIRRSVTKLHQLQPGSEYHIEKIISQIMSIYSGYYFQNEKYPSDIPDEISIESQKFSQTLDRGLREFQKVALVTGLNGKVAFDLFQTFGFPWELTAELAKEKGLKIDQSEFEFEFKKHQELSRTASAGMFKGGLADHSETVTKYHTATHLLHAALRQILGTHVQQKGSNITSERLRFDFSHPSKLTSEEIVKIETVINQIISQNLSVTRKEMPKKEALAQGAMAFFPEKYPEITSTYKIGNFSFELCGGPHVDSTGVIGRIKIVKEESAGAGIRRIYAQLE